MRKAITLTTIHLQLKINSSKILQISKNQSEPKKTNSHLVF